LIAIIAGGLPEINCFGDSTVDTGWYTGASSDPHGTGVAGVDASIAASFAASGNAHRTGRHDAGWPGWYAEFIVREQTGQQLPS
jgi:hypothetical protein